ncbi:GYF domain-containing protein [Forsythia ovata]|uniref:GYF domain-containing protein n=1 Tax=Forsythia ovata TaxID=205694 RepID=A0ABD1U8F2_9LAMI
MSSGAPQIIKDGSVGRNTTDSTQSRQSKLGSRDDLPLALDDSNNETMDSDKGSYSESFLHEKQMNSWPNAKVETVKDYQAFSDHKLNTEALKEDNSSYRKNSDMPTTKESSILGHSSILHAGTWRSSSFAERMQSASHDWREISTEVQKDLNNARDNNLTDSSYAKKGLKWPISDDSVLRRQSSAVFDRELETHKVSQPSPEGLVLYYKDPQGEIQGPFAGSDIIAWFEAGYFGIDLQVRLAGAPADSPFALLGDVMPHLRAKAQPPPGFNTPKPSEIRDASGRLIYNSIGKLHAGLSEAEMMNEPRYKHGSSTQAENQFIESLMSGNMSSAPLEKFAPSEGMPGYIGTNSSAPLPLGADGGDALHLLAKKMALERQKSLPNPFSYWPGGDAASLAAKTHVVNDSLAQQKLLSSIADNTSLLHPQNVELMSILQGLPERSMAGVNNGTGGWSNFPVQGGLDPLQDKLDMQHAGNASLNHALFQPPHELLQIGSQIQVPNLQDERASNVALPPSCSQDISPNDGSEMSSDHLPHQPFENSVHQRSWGAALPEQIDNKQQEVSLTETAVINTLSQSEMANIYTLENTLLSGEALRVITSDAVTSFPPEEHLGKSVALQLSESCENELLIPDKANEVVAPTTRGFEEPQDIEEQQNEFSSVVKEVKSAETSGMKKSLEKKSKKQKSLKAQSSDLAKGISKTQQSKSSEFEGTTVGDVKSETETVSRETLAASVPGKGERKTDKVREGAVDFLPGQNSLPACMPADDAVTAEIKGQPGQVASVSQLSTQAPSGRAWKPAPGFKPKSLLEIQQEEQRRVQEQRVVAEISTSLSTISVSTPWAGVVANSDGKVSSETLQDAATNELNLGKTEGSLNHKSKKSHLHDLYLENDVAKTNERETKISDNSHGLPSAKDTKKSRRKSSKAKGAGAKASVPLASPDVLVRSSSIDKGKSSRQIQQEKEVLPAIPSGPSLGDFVVWKDESANPSPAQAWSTDSAKLLKPTSLRDILKEQERKASSGSQAVPMQTPQKPAPSQPARGGGPSWSISSLSPAKAASPLLINSQASSQPKNKVEDDLFWGPSEQPKQEAKHLIAYLVGAIDVLVERVDELVPLRFGAGGWGIKWVVTTDKWNRVGGESEYYVLHYRLFSLGWFDVCFMAVGVVKLVYRFFAVGSDHRLLSHFGDDQWREMID